MDMEMYQLFDALNWYEEQSNACNKLMEELTMNALSAPMIIPLYIPVLKERNHGNTWRQVKLKHDWEDWIMFFCLLGRLTIMCRAPWTRTLL